MRWRGRCARWGGAIVFYTIAVLALEYMLVLSHIQYLNTEPSDTGTTPTKKQLERSLTHTVKNSSSRILLNHFGNKSVISDNGSPGSSTLPQRLTAPQISNQSLPAQVVASVPAPKDIAKLLTKPPSKKLSKTLPDILPASEKIRLIEEAKLEQTFYRLKPTKVNPYLYDFKVIPKHFCDKSTYMLILIHSFHPYGDRRRAIRNTWGSVAKDGEWPRKPINDSIRLAFVLGRHKDPGLDDLPREEGEEFNDIIQGTFMDSYTNMTLKSLLGLKFFIQHCPHARVLLKSDDDMVINLPYMLDVLHQRPLSHAIMGPLNKGARVYRSGKWKIAKEVFPFKYYPAYESGAAYAIAGDLIRDLYETAEYVPSIFIDDVYITGILGKILNVTHVYQRGFAYWVDRAPTSCAINENKVLTGTKMKPQLLERLWDELKRNVKDCPTPPPRKPIQRVLPITKPKVPS